MLFQLFSLPKTEYIDAVTFLEMEQHDSKRNGKLTEVQDMMSLVNFMQFGNFGQNEQSSRRLLVYVSVIFFQIRLLNHAMLTIY